MYQFRRAAAALAVTFFFASTGAHAAPDLTVTPSINPELAEHTRHFDKKIYEVADNVYSAVGWSLANTIMIVGDDGVVLVDPGTSLEASQELAKELIPLAEGKPVKAVVYTHFHPDHWGGVKAFVSEEQVAAGEVEIIAHDTMLEKVIHQGGLVGPITAMRSAYTFGVVLPPEDLKDMNGGIGPHEGGGTATFIAPTRTFADEMKTEIAGVAMAFFHVPSEAPDEIAVYLPANDVLLSAEVIQGPTLPNIHTLRGTKFRDPVQWVKSIDVLRTYDADFMVPSHGQPVYGEDKVEEVLRMTRDGIQFVHDQTVRYMNKGLTPDELVEKVVFPPQLRDYKPYLREYYGTVSHSVRQIYTGYLGWFEGDPTDLDPVPPVESARRTVALMGGREAVLAAAEEAYEEGDSQWAAELTTYLIRIDHGDEEARALKAASLRRLGYASMNINWHNWYLTSSMELEGKLDPKKVLHQIQQNFASADVIAQWPPRILVEGMTPRLKAEEALETHATLGFDFGGAAYALEVRNGVAQFHEGVPDDAVATISLDKMQMLGILFGDPRVTKAIAEGPIPVEGDRAKAVELLGLFEAGPPEISLTVR